MLIGTLAVLAIRLLLRSSGPGARRASVERGKTIVHQHVDVHCQDLQTTGPEREQQAEHPGGPGDCHLMFFGCVDQTVGLERVGGGDVDRFRLTLSSRF
jgi:hypothetical protein